MSNLLGVREGEFCGARSIEFLGKSLRVCGVAGVDFVN